MSSWDSPPTHSKRVAAAASSNSQGAVHNVLFVQKLCVQKPPLSVQLPLIEVNFTPRHVHIAPLRLPRTPPHGRGRERQLRLLLAVWPTLLRVLSGRLHLCNNTPLLQLLLLLLAVVGLHDFGGLLPLCLLLWLLLPLSLQLLLLQNHRVWLLLRLFLFLLLLLRQDGAAGWQHWGPPTAAC